MGLGWNTFFGGLGVVLGKVTTFFPGRIEKLKNERQRLVQERESLLSGRADAKKSARLEWVTARVFAIDGLLASKASD